MRFVSCDRLVGDDLAQVRLVLFLRNVLGALSTT